jgi:hypothetical protein
MISVAAPVVVHVGSSTDGWTVAAAVGAGVAALAALGTLIYARKTVQGADQLLAATRRAHDEEMAARRQGLEQEMLERQRALEQEISLRRIEQAQRVLDAAIELREVAFLVVATRDPEANRERLPSRGARLGAALAGLTALGGPPLDQIAELAAQVEEKTLPEIQIMGQSELAIREMRNLFATEPALRLRLAER